MPNEVNISRFQDQHILIKNKMYKYDKRKLKYYQLILKCFIVEMQQDKQDVIVRYYRRQYPADKQLVMGKVVNSQENGCYVELPEFENKKGMIPLNEYSKSMRKAVHRAMKAQKEEVLRVIRVDKEKCYIDLSKKDVNQNDEIIGHQKYANSKTVNSIIRHLSQATKIPLRSLYEQFVWDLYEKDPNHHPLDLLKQILIHEQIVNTLGIKSEDVKAKLVQQIHRRFKQSLLKTIAVFEVSVRSFQGIHKIKEILKKGVNAAKDRKYDVKIFIIGAPVYIAEVTTAKKDQGKEAIQIALNAIKDATILEKGTFQIKKQAKITGDTNAIITDIYKQEEEEAAKSGQNSEDEEAANDENAI